MTISRFFDLRLRLYSRLGYRIWGIGYICQMLETADSSLTRILLARHGARVGQNVNLKGGLFIDNAFQDQDSTGDFRNLLIGDRCYIGKRVFFDLPNKIVIEDEAVIASGVSIFTHADCGRRVLSKKYPRKTAPVLIGRGAWIGANATILCGVTVGEECVVGAGAVVTRSFPPGSVVAGVPATEVCTNPRRAENHRKPISGTI